MTDRPTAQRAESDRVNNDSYNTPAGRRRSANRLRWLGLALLAVGLVGGLVLHLWWAGIFTLLGVIAITSMLERRAWADGYEARQREQR